MLYFAKENKEDMGKVMCFVKKWECFIVNAGKNFTKPNFILSFVCFAWGLHLKCQKFVGLFRFTVCWSAVRA